MLANQFASFWHRSMPLVLLLMLLIQSNTSLPAEAQTRELAVSQQAATVNGESQMPSPDGMSTENTVPNPYVDAKASMAFIDQATPINQRNINTGVNKILTGEYAPNVFQGEQTSLVLQAAEQKQEGTIRYAANNILNASLGSINETYKGLLQFFKDTIVGNLFQNIGQLNGRWLSEFLGGWVADSAQFLAKFLRIFVLNPNIAVNGLGNNPSDGISPLIRQAADVVYGIAVDLLLLLFILCIWKYWADASWGGAGNLMAPVGRLIFTAGLLLAWPTIYAFEIQISNEMIQAIYANNPQEILMLHYALGAVVKGGVIAAGAGAFSVLAPVLTKLALPAFGGITGSVFYFASTMIFTILGGIIIAELVYILVLKAVQTALLTAQYMFAPVFLVFFATPDTESYATGYVRAFVETSLWTFIWAGLLKVLTIVLFSDFNPWGKALTSIGVLQLMIQVPSFLGRAQISPASDFISAGLVFGTVNKALTGLRDMGTSLASSGINWFTNDKVANQGLQLSSAAGITQLAANAKSPDLLHSLKDASILNQASSGLAGSGSYSSHLNSNSISGSYSGKSSTSDMVAATLANGPILKSRRENTGSLGIEPEPKAPPVTQGDSPLTSAKTQQPLLQTPKFENKELKSRLAGSQQGTEHGLQSLLGRTRIFPSAGNLSRQNAQAKTRSATGISANTALFAAQYTTEPHKHHSHWAASSSSGPSEQNDATDSRSADNQFVHTTIALRSLLRQANARPLSSALETAAGAHGAATRGAGLAVQTANSKELSPWGQNKRAPDRYAWNTPAPQTWDEPSLIHTQTRKLLSRVAETNAAGLRISQPRASILGSVAAGVQRINIAEGANDAELTHTLYAAALADNVSSDDAAKDAARASAVQAGLKEPHGLFENISANCLSNTGSSWSSTNTARQHFQQAMFQQAVLGANEYLSRREGNTYTAYLRERYGEWDDKQAAEAIHLTSDPAISNSLWNQNAIPANTALVACGIPVDKDTRAAMQNLSIQSMHPSRRKQAVFAALTYTYPQARRIHGHSDSDTLKLAHGELARALTSTEIEQALTMLQISGQDDLGSEQAVHYMSAASSLAAANQTDFATAYRQLLEAAPRKARQLGYADPAPELNQINSFYELELALTSRETQEKDLQVILAQTLAELHPKINFNFLQKS